MKNQTSWSVGSASLLLIGLAGLVATGYALLNPPLCQAHRASRRITIAMPQEQVIATVGHPQDTTSIDRVLGRGELSRFYSTGYRRSPETNYLLCLWSFPDGSRLVAFFDLKGSLVRYHWFFRSVQ